MGPQELRRGGPPFRPVTRAGWGVGLITHTWQHRRQRPQLVAGVRRGRRITLQSWALGPSPTEAQVCPRQDESAARPTGTAAVCLGLKGARRCLLTCSGRPCGRRGGRSEISTKNLVFSPICQRRNLEMTTDFQMFSEAEF